MADRYWVGGTANWDGTAGTKWALTSGGPGGEAVPTSADDVFFDAGSGAIACTIAAGNTGAKSINCTGFTGTIDGTAAITVSGSVTLVAGMTYTYTGTLTIDAASTLTSGGKTHGPITFNAAAATLTLGDACTLGATRTFTLTAGTVDLNGNTLSTGIFSSSNSNTRAITFGSANIALTSTTAATTVLSMATATNFSMTTSGGGFTRNQAATATIQFGSTAGGTASNAPNLTVNAGASALTITSGSELKNVDFTGSTCTVTATYNACGNLTLASGGTYTSVAPGFIASGTITSTGKTLGSTSVNGSGITVTLGDALTLGTGSTFTLTQGTLDLNGNTLSTGTFSSSGTGTRAITFGSANIALTNTTIATTVLSMATATGFSWTGTGGFTRNQAATATIQFGSTAGGTASNAPNLAVNAGASALTITDGSYFKNLNFTGNSSSINSPSPPASYNACGNLTYSSGGTYSNLAPIFIASGTITSNGNTTSRGIQINGSGITVTLGDAFTVGTSQTTTLTQGTLDLNGNTLSTGIFSSSNSNTRSITFGSANIALTSTTGSTTVLSMATATNFTYTGTGGFTRNMAATAIVNFGGTAGGTTSNAPNLTVNAGLPTLTIATGSYLKNVDFTGSTCSVSATYNACGNLTLASGGPYTSVVPTFIASGTLTSTGKTLGNTTVNGSGITVTLADAANCPTLTFTNGTLNLAGFTFTSTTTAATAAGTKNLTFNGGTLVCSAATTTAWNNAQPTNFTTTAGTGTGAISMTAATAKTFVGGGSTYNCTLNQGGAGTLTITGANTFNNITNTNATASQITFPASTTTTVSSFTLSGSAGNLVSLRSSTPATQFTLSDASGTVSVSYLDIQDSNATGGALWNAYLTNGNVDSGNNTGWYFTPPVGNFLLFFTN